MQSFDYKTLGFNALRHQHVWYNAVTIAEDKATPGSGPSAAMAAYSIGRYLL
jgi:hypothetical protein